MIKLPQADTTISYRVQQKYGVAKSIATFISHNHWKLPIAYTDIVDSTYLLSYSADYFCNLLHDGTVTRNGITYQVIFHRCTSVEIQHLAKKAPSAQLLLSFRTLVSDYEIEPTVLVTRKNPHTATR